MWGDVNSEQGGHSLWYSFLCYLDEDQVSKESLNYLVVSLPVRGNKAMLQKGFKDLQGWHVETKGGF